MRVKWSLKNNGKSLTVRSRYRRWSFRGSKATFSCLVHLQSFAHSHTVVGDPEVLTVPLVTDTYNYPILREEVEAALKSFKKGKSPGIYRQYPGRAGTGRRRCRDKWTQSLIITLPKKGNLQQCKNYRTISLNCHPSKVLLKVLLNRLKPQAESIIAEE